MRFATIFILLFVAPASYAGIIRQDVRHLSASGSTPLIGDVTLSAGNSITLTQVAQNITISATAGYLNIATKTANYTIAPTNDVILANGTSGSFNLSLPSATGSGKVYYIKKIDATGYGISVTANGSDTIDGSSMPEWLNIPNIIMTILDGGSGTWDVL